MLLFASLLAPAISSAQSEGDRPFRCFLKHLQTWGKEDLTLGTEMAEKLKLPEYARSEDVFDAGKVLFEKHRKDIDSILGHFSDEEFLAIPPYTDKQVQEFNTETIRADYRYARGISCCFKVIAYYLFHAGFQEDSVKLLSVNWRFGEIISWGDGEVPGLIAAMIGITIKRNSLSELFWNILAKGDFSPQFLNSISSWFSTYEKDDIAFGTIWRNEFLQVIHSMQKNAFSEAVQMLIARSPGSFFVHLLLSAFNERAVQGFRQLAITVCTAFARNRTRPNLFRQEYSRLMDETRSMPLPATISVLLGPLDSAVQVLTSLSVPPFPKAYDCYLEMKYRARGIIILTTFLAGRDKHQKIPPASKEFSKTPTTTFPPDWFADQTNVPCRFSVDTHRMTLYSVGTDARDDGGDLEKDCVLFQVPLGE